MQITQFLKRDIPESDYYSFWAGITTENTTGQFIFGLSGDAVLNFNLQSGFIYAENKKIGSYNATEQVEISGQIGNKNYDLFINNNPIILGGQKDTGNLNYFYVNSINQTTEFNLYLSNNPLSVNYNDLGFYISGQSGITGQITSNKRFTLFSGNTFNSSPFTLSGFSTGYSNIQEFYIQKTLNEFVDADLPLSFETSFGRLEFIYSITGVLPSQSTIFYSISPNTFFTTTTLDYLLEIISPTGYDLGISLSGISGTYFNYSLGETTGLYTGNITGFVENSGFISGQFLITGTGLNINNQIASGQIDPWFTSNLLYATGQHTGYFVVSGSGVGTGINFTGIATGYFGFNPIYTIISGSGTYQFGSGIVTGVAINPIFQQGTTTQVTPVTEFSGLFSGVGTGSGTYVTSGISNITGTGMSYLINDIYTRSFTDVWNLKTGLSLSTLTDYYPNHYYPTNIYSGQTNFYPNTNFINVRIEYNRTNSAVYVAKLLVTGTNNYEYLITGQ